MSITNTETFYDLLFGEDEEELAKLLELPLIDAKAFVILFHHDKHRDSFKKNLFKNAFKTGQKYFDLGEPTFDESFRWRLAAFLFSIY